jgi:hypothetical protein
MKTTQKPKPIQFDEKIKAEPKLKKVKKSEQRQQLLPGLQVGKQLALL